MMLMMRACFCRDEGHQSPADAHAACLVLAVQGHQSPADAHDACLFLAALRDIRVDAHDACLFLAALRDIRVQLMLMMRACCGCNEGHQSPADAHDACLLWLQ